MQDIETSTPSHTLEIEIAKEIFEAMVQKGALSKELEAVETMLKAAQTKLINHLIETGKKSTGHISGIGCFSLKKETYASVNKANMGIFFKSIRGTEDAAMIQEVIPAPTLKAYFKKKAEVLREEFIEEPEKIEKLFPGKDLTVDEAIKETLASVGASVFTDTKLSMTGRGK